METTSQPGAVNTSSELPDPFVRADGGRVTTASEWAGRRDEIKALLLDTQYGPLPPRLDDLRVTDTSGASVFDGAARHERVRLAFGPRGALPFSVELTIPQGAAGPFPVLLTGDRCWGTVPVTGEAVRRGYTIAEFDRTAFAGDGPGRDDGVFSLSPPGNSGVLAAWAGGYHRVVDYLMTRPDVDPGRVAVTGHSRGGKAALLAGALDERVALTAPNASGCGGAGSYRFPGQNSESLAAIVTRFPYWFHPRLSGFAGQEERLPFDQHFLLALVAPRALLLTSGLGDSWANPEGTEQTYLAARAVYQLLGAEDRIRCCYREGGHEHSAADWRTLLDFADQQFFGKPSKTPPIGPAFPGKPKAFSWEAPARHRISQH